MKEEKRHYVICAQQMCHRSAFVLLQKGQVHVQQGWLLAGAGIGLRLSKTPQLLSAFPLPGKSAAKGL